MIEIDIPEAGPSNWQQPPSPRTSAGLISAEDWEHEGWWPKEDDHTRCPGVDDSVKETCWNWDELTRVDWRPCVDNDTEPVVLGNMNEMAATQGPWARGALPGPVGPGDIAPEDVPLPDSPPSVGSPASGASPVLQVLDGLPPSAASSSYDTPQPFFLFLSPSSLTPPASFTTEVPNEAATADLPTVLPSSPRDADLSTSLFGTNSSPFPPPPPATTAPRPLPFPPAPGSSIARSGSQYTPPESPPQLNTTSQDDPPALVSDNWEVEPPQEYPPNAEPVPNFSIPLNPFIPSPAPPPVPSSATSETPDARVQRRKRQRKRLGTSTPPALRFSFPDHVRGNTDAMLHYILRPVGPDTIGHIAYRSVIACWKDLRQSPSWVRTLRRDEDWTIEATRTVSIARDTLDNLYKRRDQMEELVRDDPMNREYWMDFNAWFRLEGPYSLDRNFDAYEDSLPDTQMRGFNYAYDAAVRALTEYNQDLKWYKATADEMDWSTEIFESDSETEEEENGDDESAAWSVIEPKDRSFYQIGHQAGFGPGMRMGLVGLDMANLMGWNPKSREKGFWH